MRIRVGILVLLVISIVVFSMTNTEVSILKYQLQMPTFVGNAVGFRMVGTVEEGAFGLVWKWDSKDLMWTGQVLGYSSVFKKWLETGVFEWSKVYLDVFFLLRF